VARQQLALTGAPLRRSWSPQARYIALGWRLHELNSRLDTLERQRRMAKVRWRGESFDARPISQNPDGSWLMEAQEHTSRTAPGTRITALASEIVAGTMPGEANATPAAPPGADKGQAALDAAMAEERKTLPDPASLIAAAQAAKTAQTTQGDAGAVSGGPTQAPAGAQASNEGTKAMALGDKLKLYASGTSDFMSAIEKTVDQRLVAQAAKKADMTKRINGVFAKTDAIEADAEAGLKALENTLNQLTNQ